MKPNIGPKVLWTELLPYEFRARLAECPAVYLPLGICEPHGQVSAFGLDLFKAEWLCIEAARRTGGIVAPSMGYHIHETGYHARWLEEEVGEADPLLTGIPPAVMIHLFLYQLRSFVNAGFRTIVVVSGHSGGNQSDLRQAAAVFMEHVPVTVWVQSDPELVDGMYTGDHAGKYELSQQMYLRPDLVDMQARVWENVPGSGGKMALGDDADEATVELGQSIMNACLDRLCAAVCSLNRARDTKTIPPLTYASIEEIWRRVLSGSKSWVTAQPWPDQKPVSSRSRWKTYEYYRLDS